MAAALLGVIGVSGSSGSLPFAGLVALVAVVGASRGLAENATGVLVPQTARRGGIGTERAAGVMTSVNRAGHLAGAPAAGLLLTVLDAAAVLLVTAAALALAAALLHLAGRSASDRPGAPTSAGYLARLAEGYRFLAADSVLRTLVLLITVSNLLSAAQAAVLLPVWVAERGEASAVGAVLGAFGAGALVGNVVAAWRGPRLPRRATLVVGFLAGPLPLPLVLATGDRRSSQP